MCFSEILIDICQEIWRSEIGQPECPEHWIKSLIVEYLTPSEVRINGNFLDSSIENIGVKSRAKSRIFLLDYKNKTCLILSPATHQQLYFIGHIIFELPLTKCYRLSTYVCRNENNWKKIYVSYYRNSSSPGDCSQKSELWWHTIFIY